MSLNPEYFECETCEVSWRGHEDSCWLCGGLGVSKSYPGMPGAYIARFEGTQKKPEESLFSPG